MDKWLPSRKIVLFSGVLAILLVGLFLIFNFKNGNILYKPLNNNFSSGLFLSNIEIKNKSKIDSDFDGLKDWEEGLWKTDPNNFDTDGDGTSDGDEVKQNRNPLVKGPDDYLTNNSFFENNINQNIIKKTTETDQIAKDLIKGFIGLKQSDYLNSDNQEKLINSITEKRFNSVDYFSKKYDLSNLNIVVDSIENQESYFNNIRNLLLKTSDLVDDTIVLGEFIMKNKNGDVDDLNKSLEIYKSIQTDLIKMDVIKKVSLIHVEVINIMSDIINNVTKMKYFYKDPVGAVVGLKKSQESKDLLVKKLVEIGNYLEEMKL